MVWEDDGVEKKGGGDCGDTCSDVEEGGGWALCEIVTCKVRSKNRIGKPYTAKMLSMFKECIHIMLYTRTKSSHCPSSATITLCT